jgi:hypothetical protein
MLQVTVPSSSALTFSEKINSETPRNPLQGLSILQEPTNFQNRLETRESATSESTLEGKSSIVQQKTFLPAIHFCSNLLARGVCATTILGFIKQSSLPKHAHTYVYLSFTEGL